MMTRGWAERISERLSTRRNSNASAASSASVNRADVRSIGDDRVLTGNDRQKLETFVETVLKPKQTCLQALSVAKVDKPGKKLRIREGRDARVLAICELRRDYSQYFLHKLHLAPAATISRSWAIADLTDANGRPPSASSDLEFSLTFADKRTYHFRANSVAERNRFLWELVQVCRKSKGKAPNVHGIRLLTLQEDAEKAAHVDEVQVEDNDVGPTAVPQSVLSDSQGDGDLLNGQSGAPPSVNKVQNGISGHLNGSSASNGEMKVESRSSESGPLLIHNEGVLDNDGRDDDDVGNARNMDASESKMAEEMKRREEERMAELAKLCLSDEQVEDLLVTLESFDLGGNASGVPFCDQLQEEIRELEAANMLDLIRSEEGQAGVITSLEKLQLELEGADVWLKECDVRLSSCTVVVRDIEKKMESLEVQMTNAKALAEVTEKVLGSVTLSSQEESIVSLITESSSSNRLDDDKFVLTSAKKPLNSLVEKLNFEPSLRELNDIDVLSSGRAKVLGIGGAVVVRLQDSLRSRVCSATTEGAGDLKVSLPSGESLKAFSLLCATMMGIRPKAAMEIVNLYESRAESMCNAQLQRLQASLAERLSVVDALNETVECLTPICRTRSQLAHALFDLAADAAGKDRAAFVGKILQAEFHRIPQLFDDLVSSRVQRAGMMVYLEAHLWANRLQKLRQSFKVNKGEAVPLQMQRPEDSLLLQEMLSLFALRCKERLEQHAEELIFISYKAANFAAASAASAPADPNSRITASSNSTASSPFAVFYMDNYGMLKLGTELITVARHSKDTEGLRFALSLTERMTENVIKHTDIAAFDDGTRSLVVRAENFHCIVRTLGDFKYPRIAELVKQAVQGEERVCARCVDRSLRWSLSRILEACTAPKSEVTMRLSGALAEARDEARLARSMVQPLEENMSPAARKTLLPQLLRQISAATSDRLNRVSKFMAADGMVGEEQGLQTVRRKLDASLLQMRLNVERK